MASPMRILQQLLVLFTVRIASALTQQRRFLHHGRASHAKSPTTTVLTSNSSSAGLSVAGKAGHAGIEGDVGLRVGPCGGSGVDEDLFGIYKNNLLQGVCSLPLSHTEAQMTCRNKLECLLNDFYSGGCGGIKNYPADLCKVCTSEMSMRNSTVGGQEYVKVNGTYFYEYRQHFEEAYSSYPEYMEVIKDSVRGKQLSCGAMIMVKDKCAKAPTPSCNSWDVEGWRRVYKPFL